MSNYQDYNWNGWNDYNTNMQWHEFDYTGEADKAPVLDNNYYSSNYISSVPAYYSPNVQSDQIFQACNNEDFEFDTEPPLLEELGINFSHIKEKTLAVLNPRSTTTVEAIEDQDLAGPLVFCLLLGFALLLHGKLSFGEIYGLSVFACTGLYFILNAMTKRQGISFCCIASILGYCLLPMTIMTFIIAVLPSKTLVSYCLAGTTVLWCTFSCSKLIVTALDLNDRYVLVFYPCFLIYLLFALLAIF